jgi:hypothetical protein
MKVRKVIRRRLGESGAVNAVVAANVNEPGPSVVKVSSKQRIVQQSGRQRGRTGDAREDRR